MPAFVFFDLSGVELHFKGAADHVVWLDWVQFGSYAGKLKFSGCIGPVEFARFHVECLCEDVDGIGGGVDFSEFDAGDLGVRESGVEGEGFDGQVPCCSESSQVPSQLMTECFLAFHRCSPKVAATGGAFKSIHALF